MTIPYATIDLALTDGWIFCRGMRRRDHERPNRRPEHFLDAYLPGLRPPYPQEGSDPGRYLYCRDISGIRYRGYQYGLFYSAQDFLGTDQLCLLKSTSLWIREALNQMGLPGAVVSMFRRDQVQLFAQRYPYAPPTLPIPSPVTAEDLEWIVFRHPHWLHHECPAAEAESLRDLSVATVRGILEIKRRPHLTLDDEGIQAAIRSASHHA